MNQTIQLHSVHSHQNILLDKQHEKGLKATHSLKTTHSPKTLLVDPKRQETFKQREAS